MSTPSAPPRARPESSGRWATRANLLTALRLAAAPGVAWAIVAGESAAAVALFALAVATDLLDGPVARRFGESSPLGGLLDHATDASFVCAGLGALAWLGEVPWPLPALVATAFAQYALDSEVLPRSAPGRGPAPARPLRRSSLGRANGIAYFVVLGIPVVRDALGLAAPQPPLVHGLGALLVLSTLVSMAARARAGRRARSGAAG